MIFFSHQMEMRQRISFCVSKERVEKDEQE